MSRDLRLKPEQCDCRADVAGMRIVAGRFQWCSCAVGRRDQAFAEVNPLMVPWAKSIGRLVVDVTREIDEELSR